MDNTRKMVSYLYMSYIVFIRRLFRGGVRATHLSAAWKICSHSLVAVKMKNHDSPVTVSTRDNVLTRFHGRTRYACQQETRMTEKVRKGG